ncbi:hypothetical protein V8C86DRAFT_1148684 [Haematococcus lacustris]
MLAAGLFTQGPHCLAWLLLPAVVQQAHHHPGAQQQWEEEQRIKAAIQAVRPVATTLVWCYQSEVTSQCILHSILGNTFLTHTPVGMTLECMQVQALQCIPFSLLADVALGDSHSSGLLVVHTPVVHMGGRGRWACLADTQQYASWRPWLA